MLFLNTSGIQLIKPPPYSPDLTSCVFWLFPKVKEPLRGKVFRTREELIDAVENQLKQLKKEDFQRCFQNWLRHLQKYIDIDGGYIEKCWINIISEKNIKKSTFILNLKVWKFMQDPSYYYSLLSTVLQSHHRFSSYHSPTYTTCFLSLTITPSWLNAVMRLAISNFSGSTFRNIWQWILTQLSHPRACTHIYKTFDRNDRNVWHNLHHNIRTQHSSQLASVCP